MGTTTPIGAKMERAGFAWGEQMGREAEAFYRADDKGMAYATLTGLVKGLEGCQDADYIRGVIAGCAEGIAEEVQVA